MAEFRAFVDRLLGRRRQADGVSATLPDATISDRMRTGFEAQRAGDAATARQMYLDVLAVRPSHADAHYLIGLLDAADANADAALHRLDTAISLDPERSAFHFSRAQVVRAAGDLATAISGFARAVALDPTDLEALRELGRTAETAGDFDVALRTWRALVAVAADDAEAWAGVGGASLALGEAQSALEAFEHALTLSPTLSRALAGAVEAARATDDAVQFEAAARRALVIDPALVPVLVNYGGWLADQRRATEAVELLERATTLAPEFAPAWINLGGALRGLGQLDAAHAAHSRAVEIAPELPVARLQLAITLEFAHRFGEAEGLLHSVVADRPDDAIAWYALGNVQKGQRAFDEAERSYRRAIDLAPDNASLWIGFAHLLSMTERFEAAAGACEEAVRRNPDDAHAQESLGVVRMRQRRIRDAVAALEHSIQLEPTRISAHNALCCALIERHDATAAETVARNALTLAPDDPDVLLNLGMSMLHQGRARDATDVMERVTQLQPSNGKGWSNWLMDLNYRDDLDAKAIFAAHRRFGDAFRPHRGRDAFARPSRSAGRRLRVGYVSTDFRNHVVAQFAAGVLAHHDRSRFEIHAFHNYDRSDFVTDRIRTSVEHWTDIQALDHDECEAALLASRLDIAIDLGGHAGLNRLPVFARRIAPVQISWIGYPNTTGLEAMDWKISDAIADPAPAADAVHTEGLLRMPDVFTCWTPPAEAPAVADPPLPSAQRPIVFGMFNNLAKVSPTSLDMVAAAMRAVPAAQLHAKTSALRDAPVRDRFVAALAERGIAPARIRTSGWMSGRDDHFRAWQAVDIGLDTFPYHGTTTTCDALWMGVPVVSRMGDRHASRVGATLLAQVGLGELAVDSAAAWVEAVTALAGDFPRRLMLRRTLRDRMREATLTRPERFTPQLEQALERVWTAWRDAPD